MSAEFLPTLANGRLNEYGNKAISVYLNERTVWYFSQSSILS